MVSGHVQLRGYALSSSPAEEGTALATSKEGTPQGCAPSSTWELRGASSAAWVGPHPSLAGALPFRMDGRPGLRCACAALHSVVGRKPS